MTAVVIAGAARTPIGSFMGSLGAVEAHDLGAAAITGALARAKAGPGEVSEVIMGQVLTAGGGMNPARQAALKAGVPVSSTALTINQVCGSGLRSVAMAFQAIQQGDARIVAAGGQESMSLSGHCFHLRGGPRMGHGEMTDTMISDGLWDVFNDYHMGVTAENVAGKWGIGRAEQDAFACTSQNKAEAAQKDGRFSPEIVTVTVKTRRGETVVDTDEFPRHGTTVEGLASLKPAFAGDGTITAGNASGINDGAAALVLMSAEEAERRSVEPLARIVSWATAGVDPALMGTGPIPASRAALDRAGWKIEDLDLIEANEAFAAQAIAVNREMGWARDGDRVNVNGGAIALGHPIGASGARILVTLVHEMGRREAARGLATLCIGGGMGIAMCVERD